MGSEWLAIKPFLKLVFHRYACGRGSVFAWAVACSSVCSVVCWPYSRPDKTVITPFLCEIPTTGLLEEWPSNFFIKPRNLHSSEMFLGTFYINRGKKWLVETHLEVLPPTSSKDRNFWKRRDPERVVWKPLSKEPTSQVRGWETCEEIFTFFLPSEALLFYHWICEHRLWAHSLRSSKTAERARLREISQSCTLLSYMTPGQVFHLLDSP